MSAAPTSEAPPVEAPSTPAAGEIVDNGQAHQEWTFPATPAVTPTPEPEAKTDPVVPEVKAPEPDSDIDDETFERVRNSPRIQKLVDDKAAGTVGAKLQAERPKIEAETRQAVLETEARWEAALTDYNKLHESDDYYKEQVSKHGKAKVTRFLADVEAVQEARAKGPVQPAFDTVAYQKNFNSEAVDEFKVIVKDALPSYAELPEATRAAIDGLKYDPDGSIYGEKSNWLHHALVQIGKGYEAHIAKLQKARASDLESATQAGRNDALAEREAGAPVVVRGEANIADLSWPEVNELYAEGRLPGGRAAFLEAKRKHGIDY